MPQRPSFASLQALRAIAALLVVLFHLRIVEARYGDGAPLLPGAMRFADGGVDLFFVISGFIMATITAGAFRGPAAAARFMGRRAWRILPPYWLYTTLVVILLAVAPGIANSSYQDQGTLASYLLWPQEQLPLLTVGWTLIHEMYFYLVIAALIASGWRRLTPALLAWAALVVLANMSTVAGAPWYALVTNVMTLEFIAGALLGLYWRRIPAALGTSLLACGALGFLVALPLLELLGAEQGPVLRTAVFGTASTLLVAGAVMLESRGGFRVPARLRAVGDSSYSLYLSHVFVLSATGRLWHMSGLTGTWWQHAGFIACALALSVLAGLASYRWLERPLHRAGSDLLRPPVRTAATQSA
ncbi:acyltransferase [Lysobacter sp. GX 14042]|uniref:acyltransferase family protein n=1 Tax=Lysobacter sp. GX 14042 TaxID=2907155 RepID=UPI001F32C206|nr:acyltransferase [Lysobacter sp. GX 14042]MCE7033275.1 acyltransferase [Lysobacter sp. GX 14042]